MNDKKQKDIKSPSLKKETYQQLHTQLLSSLAWLKELLGDKKFDNRIKKASKILSDGIKEKKTKKLKPRKVAKAKPAATEPIS